MTTLQEAWEWYEATLKSLRQLERLGEKYWDDLPWGGPLGRDNTLRSTAGDAVFRHARIARQPLADLAVLVFFSTFEAIVRERVAEQAAAEAAGLRHPALAHAARDALDAITDGSFFRVLEPYKSQDAGLIEGVNQVRRYRNWVAHGRRGGPANAVDPKMAYDRLSRFLSVLNLTSERAPPEATA